MQKDSTAHKQKREVPLKLNLAFATGEISDLVAYQGFGFLVFTFYYDIMGLNVYSVSWVFVVWAVYASLFNAVLGGVSDRTKTRRLGGGRRRPWIVATLIPLPLVMLLLFTPPQGNTTLILIYFVVIVCVFDTVYSSYSLNHTSLYPEMFLTDKAREEVGASRRILMVVALLVAFVMPSLFITDMTVRSPSSTPQYDMTGIAFGIVIFFTMLILLKWGIKEPPIEQIEAKKMFGIKESIKVTLKNRKFLIFVVCSTLNWYVFGLLPLIVPIYAHWVLGATSTLLTSLLLLVAFLCSIPGVLIWSKVDAKLGSRKGFMCSSIWWACSLIPLLFLRNYDAVLVMMAFIGIGLGGGPYYIDRNISNIIDDDELRTNQRREGSYYGVHALLIRLAIVVEVATVSVVLATNGWEILNPSSVSPGLILGLQMLMSVFPAGALLIGLIFLKLFPFTKAVVDEMQARYKERAKQASESSQDVSEEPADTSV